MHGSTLVGVGERCEFALRYFGSLRWVAVTRFDELRARRLHWNKLGYENALLDQKNGH